MNSFMNNLALGWLNLYWTKQPKDCNSYNNLACLLFSPTFFLCPFWMEETKNTKQNRTKQQTNKHYVSLRLIFISFWDLIMTVLIKGTWAELLGWELRVVLEICLSCKDASGAEDIRSESWLSSFTVSHPMTGGTVITMLF